MSQLDSIDGVLEHDVDHQADTAEVRLDGDQVTIEEIEDSLEEVGYRPETATVLSDSE